MVNPVRVVLRRWNGWPQRAPRLLWAVLCLSLFTSSATAQITADFTASVTSGQNTLQVSFTDTSTGTTPVLWMWSFGDGASSSQQNPTHTYQSPGSYTVSLQALASAFDFDIETKTDYITVDPAPLVVNFSGTPTTGPHPLTVAFTDGSTGGTTTAWSWDFGDGSTSSLQHPTHVYTAPGSYSVAFTSFVGLQSSSLVKNDYITADLAPLVVDFDATPVQGVNSLQVAFSDASTGATTTVWLWDFGDGNASVVQHPSHTYTAPGDYTVSLTASVGPQSDTLTQQDLISVAPAVFTADFAAAAATPGNPFLIDFTDLSSGAPVDGWLWDFGDGASSSAQHPSHAYDVDDQATFTVSLTAFVGQQSEVVLKQDVVSIVAPFRRRTIGSAPGNVRDIEAVDVDSDGDADVLSASTESFIKYSLATVGWYENLDSLGNFGLQAVLSIPGGSSAELVAADLDGDGDKDVLVAYAPNGGSLLWATNSDGLGNFGASQLIDTAGTNGFTAAEVGDLDGDGDLDVLSALGTFISTGTKVVWYENADGMGSYGAAQLISTGNGISQVITADFDSDGDPDVLWMATNASTISWAENIDGLGAFGPSQQLTSVSPRAIAVADLDGDADLDVLALNQFPQTMEWYSNTDGQGGFGPAQLIASPLAFDVHLADIDGDGDVDVLSGASFASSLAWYDNADGGGAFGGPQVLSVGTDGVTVLAGADLDGDGDQDIVSGGSGTVNLGWFENRVVTPSWANLGSSLMGAQGLPLLQGAGEPERGEIVTVSLSNALGSAATTLVIGLTSTSTPFKGGVLVPSPDVLITGLQTDVAGLQSISGVWPGGVPPGTVTVFQYWIVDQAAPQGLAASNGLSATTAP